MDRPKRNVSKPKEFTTLSVCSKEEKAIRQAMKASIEQIEQTKESKKNKSRFRGADGCLPGPSTKSPIYSQSTYPSQSATDKCICSPTSFITIDTARTIPSPVQHSTSSAQIPVCHTSQISNFIPLVTTSILSKSPLVHSSSVSAKSSSAQLTTEQQTRIKTNKEKALKLRAISRAKTPAISAMKSSDPAHINPSSTTELPVYNSMCATPFTWGKKDAVSFEMSLNQAYEEVVHWRKNVFEIPHGHVGEAFIKETARLFNEYAIGSPLEKVCMKCIGIMTHLLLQKTQKV
jgi:hypothetical protein